MHFPGRVDATKRTEDGTHMQRDLSDTAVFEPAEEGGFVVTFPAIPGLATQGETLDEASAMAENCLRAHLESLAIDGEPPPYEAPALRVVVPYHVGDIKRGTPRTILRQANLTVDALIELL